MPSSVWNSLAVFAVVLSAVTGEYVCFYDDQGCTTIKSSIPCLVGPPNTGECGSSPVAPQFKGQFTSQGNFYEIATYLTPDCSGAPLVTLNATLDECTKGGAAGIDLIYKVTMGPQDTATNATTAATSSAPATTAASTPTTTSATTPPEAPPEAPAATAAATTTPPNAGNRVLPALATVAMVTVAALAIL